MDDVSTELAKAEVRLKWDPSPFDEPRRHLDIIAATYTVDDPYGAPAHVVHSESRSPDGTITMSRHSETGLGLGFVEVMVLEFDRMPPSCIRVVVGIGIHQDRIRRTFGDIANAGVLIVEGHEPLLTQDFARVSEATAATVGEFKRGASGLWTLRETVRGFDAEPIAFAQQMGTTR